MSTHLFVVGYFFELVSGALIVASVIVFLRIGRVIPRDRVWPDLLLLLCFATVALSAFAIATLP